MSDKGKDAVSVLNRRLFQIGDPSAENLRFWNSELSKAEQAGNSEDIAYCKEMIRKGASDES